MKPVRVKVSELGLGDIVNTGYLEAEYSSATVYRIDGGLVYLTRPYIHTNDVVYVGNTLISYIGHEEYTLMQDSSHEVWLLRKNREPLR